MLMLVRSVVRLPLSHNGCRCQGTLPVLSTSFDLNHDKLVLTERNCRETSMPSLVYIYVSSISGSLMLGPGSIKLYHLEVDHNHVDVLTAHSRRSEQ